MKIKEGMEQAYANFIAEHQTSESDRALLGFMETWSGMMECAVDLGADNITEIAKLTVQPAAAAAGIMDDEDAGAGAAQLVKYWEHGEDLEEWSVYHPPEILTENRSPDLWGMSPETLDVLPELVNAYPCIQDAYPDILEQRQVVMDAPLVNAYPQMSM